MSSIFEFGGPQFGVQDAKVADRNTDGTYGTAKDIPSVNSVRLGPELVTSNLEGDDKITATYARLSTLQVTLVFGSIDIQVLSIVLGNSYSDSGSGPELRTWEVGNENSPKVGLAFKTSGQDGGDTQVFFPNAVLTSVDLAAEYGNFSQPTMTFQANMDDDKGYLMKVYKHATATDLTIPPT